MALRDESREGVLAVGGGPDIQARLFSSGFRVPVEAKRLIKKDSPYIGIIWG